MKNKHFTMLGVYFSSLRPLCVYLSHITGIFFSLAFQNTAFRHLTGIGKTLSWLKITIMDCELLRVTFCKTDTPEIHDPHRFPWFLAHVFTMTRNAFPTNFSFLAKLLSKLQHLKKCFNFRRTCGFYDQCILRSHSNVILAYYWQFTFWAY